MFFIYLLIYFRFLFFFFLFFCLFVFFITNPCVEGWLSIDRSEGAALLRTKPRLSEILVLPCRYSTWSEPHGRWWWNRTLVWICPGSSMFMSDAWNLCFQKCQPLVLGRGKLIFVEEPFPGSEPTGMRTLCLVTPLSPRPQFLLLFNH